jgi:hypothetical protein
VLNKYPIREIADYDLRDVIVQALKYGDRPPVTFLKPSGHIMLLFEEKKQTKLFEIINNCFLTVSKLANAYVPDLG